jgi:DNA-binding response OmpR family regulator
MQKGSGIGLSLVKELALLHGGNTMAFNNTAKGCSCKVWIKCERVDTYKLKNTHEATKIVESPCISETSSSITENAIEMVDEKPLILVVEDQPELRQFIVENIGSNYQCIEAENGKIGIELAEKFVPDIIISDVMMPVMNGLELCKNIKGNDITSHIPFVMLTAKADKGDKISGLETGADDYILKPFSIEELKLKLRNILRLQEIVRKKFQGVVVPQQENTKELSQRDRELLSKLNAVIEANITEPQLGVETLAVAAFLSNKQLTRKLKTLIGQTPADLIRNVRLQKALQLLGNGMNITETSWETGFEDTAYFSKVFKKHFGVVPSEFKLIKK